MLTILLLIVILMLFGAIPRENRYSANWGYAPSGFLGIVVIVLVVIVLWGRI